jgi:hypothetical protein
MAVTAALVCVLVGTPVLARDNNQKSLDKLKALERIMVLDGSAVHNVGNLQVNVTNWGVFGSYPSSTLDMSESPSAQWPANSGVEYLYIGGIWFGAKVGGIPVVSTAAYEAEFRPTREDVDVIYRSFEGAIGGARLPSPPDDDKDGFIDEDWLNGRDDDFDGKIDEDFAAIGKQMFSCWFTDDQPYSIQINPEHTPLGLFVRQESYQWEEERFYNSRSSRTSMSVFSPTATRDPASASSTGWTIRQGSGRESSAPNRAKGKSRSD